MSILQDFLLVFSAGWREYLLEHINNFYMDSKGPLLSPFNYADWKSKMRESLKRQCLFDVSICALSEPESYEETIDWIRNCDRD